MPILDGSHLNKLSFSAPAKSILLGEHFVVHGCRALAIPLAAVGTTIELTDPSAPKAHVQLDLDKTSELSEDDKQTAYELTTAAAAGVAESTGRTPRGSLRIRSTIPIGCGLGSSAAFAVAVVGALHRAVGCEPSADQLRAQAHVLERRVHGAPSGIDDSVIASGRPLVFWRDAAGRGTMDPVEPGAPFSLLFASVGRPLPTCDAVARVAALRDREPRRFEGLLAQARETVERGISAFTDGDVAALGPELDRCHRLLQQVGVSTEELDRLVDVARCAGARGAKLTGAGLGGFMLALVDDTPEQSAAVSEALQEAGARDTFSCQLAPQPKERR